MQGSLWVPLLRRIPAAKHDCLIVVTATGVELMVNKLLRLEADFLVMRARLVGATDLGRIIVLPYEQISNVAFNKILPESELRSIFGNLEAAANFAEMQSEAAAPAAVVERPAAAVAPPVLEWARPPEVATPEPAPAAAASAAAALAGATPAAAKPSKSILLARLRARLANSKPHNG